MCSQPAAATFARGTVRDLAEPFILKQQQNEYSEHMDKNAHNWPPGCHCILPLHCLSTFALYMSKLLLLAATWIAALRADLTLDMRPSQSRHFLNILI
jgi:hypothetical protein